jgi:glycosyltransferase involved in cell wall biosynthesis
MNSFPVGTPAHRRLPALPVPICFPLAGDIPVGGGHVSVLLLIQNLDRRRFRPIIAVHGDGPVRRWLAEQGGVPEIEALQKCVRDRHRVRIGEVALICRRSWALARFLRERKVQIVHINDTIMLQTWALAARLAGAKLLWHKRGPWNDRWLHRLWFRAADHVIAISRYAAPPLPSPKCSIIYNAAGDQQQTFDRAASRQHLLSEIGFPAGTKILGFFADIDKERKRPAVFLEIIAQVQQKSPQLRAVGLLFGQASSATQRQLRARAESLGIADRIRFMGFRYPAGPWIAGCDLLIVPSVGEGFGRTLIEAMALGTIAVAADSGGHREIIEEGETGFLVPPDDVRAFADRVCRLLDRPNEVAALARRSRQHALERFGTHRHAQSVIEVYDGLLSADGRLPAAAVLLGAGIADGGGELRRGADVALRGRARRQNP